MPDLSEAREAMTYENEHLLAMLSVACWLAGMVLGYGIRWVQEGWQKHAVSVDRNEFIRMAQETAYERRDDIIASNPFLSDALKKGGK
jgi:hypothetical protein